MRRRQMPTTAFKHLPTEYADEDDYDRYGMHWSVLVELPLGDDWCLFGRFIRTPGGAALAEVRIFPAEAVPTGEDRRQGMGSWSEQADVVAQFDEGITARLLRTISVTALEDAMRQRVAHELKQQRTIDFAEWPSFRASLVQRRPGRAGREDRFYAEWAARYVAELERGTRAPVKALAKQHRMKPEQVRDVVRRARERDLLTSGTQGRSGGELTDKGRKALMNKEK